MKPDAVEALGWFLKVAWDKPLALAIVGSRSPVVLLGTLALVSGGPRSSLP